jgi:cell division septum initiation protein DivIVA
MKPIHSIKQLRKEKKRMQHRVEELETRLKEDWEELKYNLKPGHLARETLSMVTRAEKRKKRGVLKTVLSVGAHLLARKLANKADEKLDHLFSENGQAAGGEHK